MKKRILINACAALALVSSFAMAHDYTPAPPQNHPVLLKGGDLYTVSQGVMTATDLLFEKGRITQIGKNLSAPADANIIDVSGKRVYPGLIAPETSIGLIEIGAVDATNDLDELGGITPEVRSHIAYNPDSEIIPTVRLAGITTAVVAPRGSLVRGISCLMNMDGWTKEDAAEIMELGLHVGWPRSSINTAWWESRTPEEQKKQQAKNRKELTDLFDGAREYATAKDAGTVEKLDIRWESMLPAIRGEMPVFIVAQDYRQIDQALVFAEKYGLKIVIVGGAESWRLTERLVRQNVPVVLRRTHSMPYRQDYDYDMAFKVPRLLEEAGVKYCFSNITGGTSSWDTRSLPFQAGQAVAFGLSAESALRGVTLSTAEILGVADDLGSLDVGKRATIIVSEGDVLDQLTNRVVYEFIQGRPVDLNSRHKELFEKYKSKTLSQQ